MGEIAFALALIIILRTYCETPSGAGGEVGGWENLRKRQPVREKTRAEGGKVWEDTGW